MTLLALGALVLFAGAFSSLQTPSACTARSAGGVADGPALDFERIATSATVIAEATVQSVVSDPPATGPGSPISRDHAVLLATRVIKGPDSLGLFTVNQLRVAGLFELRPGRGFVVFLTTGDPRMPVSPERPDLPRYGLAGGGRSMLCVDAGKVWVNPNGEFLRARFDGVELEKAVADIRAYLKLEGR